MANRLTFVANLLIGVAAGAATITSAAAQQVELVPFRNVGDGVVIEVGKKPIGIEIPAALPNEATALSAEMLAQDFAGMAPPPSFAPAIAMAPVERSSIPVPLWMRTGKVTTSGLAAAAAVAPYLYSPAACSISPYRPRGDLPMYLEQRRARYYPLISAVACEAGVPVGLFDALVAQESQYNPQIVSPKGAVGLTQLMPGTAAYLGVFNSRCCAAMKVRQQRQSR